MANNNDNRDQRGFASMDENRQREIASKGGQASPSKFSSDNEESRRRAQEAGRRGGMSRAESMNQERNQNQNQDMGNMDGERLDE